MKNILVSGATGYIGGRLIPRLVELGYNVRAMAREPAKLARRDWPNVEIVKADVFDSDSLNKALANIDCAYYFIHSMTTSSYDTEFRERDYLAAKNFAQACSAQGVKRIIYLGGLGITGSALSEHLKSRHETGDALRSGNVPVTELRAAIIVGSGSASFIIIYDLVRKLPFMICPKWVSSLCEPISIRQVLSYLTAVLTEERSIGQILEIGGGEVLTYKQMMEICAKVLGKKRYMLTVPVLTPGLSSYWLNLVTSVPLSLARPLVEGLKSNVVCNDFRIREWIKVEQISYEESVRLAVNKMLASEVESAWTEASTSISHSQLEYFKKEPTFVDHRSCYSTAAPEKVFEVFQAVGGERGWYHATWLWQIRALMDWAIGGIGMRRGRRDPEKLEVGDPLDFWRVEEIIPNRLIVLRAEMKLPGTARLIFSVEPDEKGSKISLKAHFWASSFWGNLYWYLVCPLHGYVFSGLLKKIVSLAEDRT